ncbi:MAG TPA: cytidylate kinase-like family protein, partial [Candidatus Elarobacter sp.]|nr:cytidylate kinase-like family protein [Candidatus Elarobacter sp.]
MSDNRIDLITVSREFGAGGSEFAKALGVRPGWPVCDREIVERVAGRLKLDRRTVEALDEHAPGFLARVAQTLMVAPIELPLMVETSEMLNPDAVAEATQATVRDAAQSTPVVIVGHAGQAIFAGRPDTLHVRLV